MDDNEFVFVSCPTSPENGDQEEEEEESVPVLISPETSSSSSPLLHFHDDKCGSEESKAQRQPELETKIETEMDEGYLKSLLEMQIVGMETHVKSMQILAGKIPSDRKLSLTLKKIRQSIEKYKSGGNFENAEPQNFDSQVSFSTGNIKNLPLDVLTKSLEFNLKQLEIRDSENAEFREEVQELIKSIGGLPLVLQLAGAFIKQEQKHRKFLRKTYEIKDYVQHLKSTMGNFHFYSPVFGFSSSGSSTVFVTWYVTFEKIKKLPNGKEAVKILELLSFLHDDKIPLSFLHALVPEMEEGEFSGALRLLEKYSVIKMNDKDFSLSIHGQLQFVILQSLKESRGISRVVTSLLKKCHVVLKNLKVAKSSEIFFSLHQIATNQFDLIFPVSEKSEFLDFVHEFGVVLYTASRYSESLELYKNVYSGRRELLGENHAYTLAAQHQIALNLSLLGKYDESLNLYKENLKKQESHPDLGVDHSETVTTKHNIAEILRLQKKYPESLELFGQVLAEKTKIHGENSYHPDILRTQSQIAVVYSELGDFSTALELFETVEMKRVEILGPYHLDFLETKHNKAIVLVKMDQFEEASRIFNEVHEKQKEILGENHFCTNNTLHWICWTLEKQGKFKEALQIYKTRV